MNNNELQDEDYPLSKGGINTKYYTPLLELFYNIYISGAGGEWGGGGEAGATHQGALDKPLDLDLYTFILRAELQMISIIQL